jgi:rare lipoprotein A (peptidoglycan hydrolase)
VLLLLCFINSAEARKYQQHHRYHRVRVVVPQQDFFSRLFSIQVPVPAAKVQVHTTRRARHVIHKVAAPILPQLPQVSVPGTQCGIASVYGGNDGLCNHLMANGKKLNCNALTAAHKTLPFGTHVTVNGCDITITDRGPFIKGRVIDLSPAAAKCAGINGLGKVCF